jgi:hypothetical protein
MFLGVWLTMLLVLALGAHAAEKPVQLTIENVALSVWDTDATMVGVALQIRNVGTASADNVRVFAVVIFGGTFAGPDPLPLSLGSIGPAQDVALDLVVKVPKTDGTRYLLTILGHYTYSGKVPGFFLLNRHVAPQPDGNGPFRVRDGVAVIQDPSTAFYPVPPPLVLFGPNTADPILIPPGPPRQIFPATPIPTPVDTIPGANIEIPVNTSQTNAGLPPDPNAAASAGGVVLSTYNTGISYSLDGGTTFTDVNLFAPQPGNPSRASFFPQSDAGLCCDQVVVYLPEQNLFVWLLQYRPVVCDNVTIPCPPPPSCPTGSTNCVTQPNRLRIAWATPQAIAADFWNAWIYGDLTGNQQTGVSDGLGTAGNEWLDYPDLAYSDTYLYVGTDHGTPTGHLRQDKLYIKENKGILHEVKISPAAYRRDVPCSCP